MKLFVVAAVLGVCSAARLDNAYLPPRGNSGSGAGAFGAPAPGNNFKSAGQGGNQGGFGGGNQGGFGGGNQGGFGGGNQGGFGGQHGGGNQYGQQQQSSRPEDGNAQILKLNSDVKADSFSYEYETSNGIRADASGVATNGVQSQGSFAYKGDDGQEYSITYTADENGYQPQGAHLPTPPPIPEEILKALEQNARDEAAGISDDGQYRGEGAGHGGQGGQGGYSGNQGYGNQGSGNQGYSAPSNQYSAPQKQNNFNAGANRQYIPPASGPARGSGNFNQQSGYQY